MKQIVNIEVILSVCDFLSKELTKPDINLASLTVYPFVHPSKNLPGAFLVVKAIAGFDDIGNVDVDGVLEFCIYVRNLNKGDDQTQPDYTTINNLTKEVMQILDGAVIGNTVITSIKPTLVSDPDIRYFYNSLICETLSVKQY